MTTLRETPAPETVARPVRHGVFRLFQTGSPEEPRRIRGGRWVLNLAALLVFCCGVSFVSLRYASAHYGPELLWSLMASPGLFLLNTLPVLAIALLLVLLTNRFWPGVLASGVLTLTLTLIHYYKLMFRDDPLLAGDWVYLAEAVNISSRYEVQLTRGMIPCYLIVLLLSVLAFFFLKARFRKPLPRLIDLAVLFAACVGLYSGVYANDGIYNALENYDVAFADETVSLNRWSDTDRFCSHGFWYPLLHSFRNQVTKPEGYTKGKALEALAQYPENQIPEEKRINFISIMLEAFADLTVYDDRIDFLDDPLAFYHRLQEESLSGTLLTNIFAGGTIDTERCYITGSTQMYEYRGAADSYARYFANQGYLTEFCHPGFGWFYNRQNVMEYLGFENVWFTENRFDLDENGNIITDGVFFPAIEEMFEASVAAGRPYFNFSVTYQNHGPYPADYNYAAVKYAAQGELGDESYNILTNYLWGIHVTDWALQQMVDYFRWETKEPVVLVLFGDHKPWLGDGASVYRDLGIDLDRSTPEGFGNYYSTQYVIWANQAAREILGDSFQPGDGGTISPCYLMMKVFDLCGFGGDSYMGGLRALYPYLNVANSGGWYEENGVLTDSPSPEARSRLDQVLYMQYYRMRDWAKDHAP